MATHRYQRAASKYRDERNDARLEAASLRAKLTPKPITPELEESGERVQVWFGGRWRYAAYDGDGEFTPGWRCAETGMRLDPAPTHYLPEPDAMEVG